MVLWVVKALIVAGSIVGLGGLVGGRFLGMPHASKAAVGGLITVILSAIGVLVLPGILEGWLGTACIPDVNGVGPVA